jgi:hypothetical protein
MMPRDLLRHLGRYHDPGFFAACPHNPMSQAVFHDSAHSLAEGTDVILHTHLKSTKAGDDDD